MGGSGSVGRAGGHLALQTEAVEPSGVVELSVVGLDLAEVVIEDHVVDTHDGGLGLCGCLPFPCDLVAAVGHHQGLDGHLRLHHALAVVEGGSRSEGNTAKLEDVSDC